MSNNLLTLFYNRACPYAHRALITTYEKNIPSKNI